MSLNEQEYKQNIQAFKIKYQSEYPAVYDYVNDQWLEGVFNNWQIYHNEPDYANTNSNVESFNNVIKKYFTGRRRLGIKTAIDKMSQIIIYYSTKGPVFETKPRFDSKMKSIAEKFTQSNFKVIRKNKLVSYTGKNNKFTIKLDAHKCYKSLSCRCRNFFKQATSPHLLGYSMINCLNIYDKAFEASKEEGFVSKNKKGRRRHAEKAYEK